MAVRYYDEALLKKIRGWIIDPKVNVLGPTESRDLFRMISDRNSDKELKLPLIALTRSGYCRIANTNKRALSYDGGHIDVVSEKRSGVLNAIPINITYTLSIYARYFEEADEYARNFIFNLINYPVLSINIPYQDVNKKHTATINVDSNVTDNSGSSGRLANDQFYRIDITININDAYLFSIPILYNYDIDESSLNDIYLTKEDI